MTEEQIYNLEKKAIEIDRKFKEQLVDKIIQKIPEFNQEEFSSALVSALSEIKIVVPEIQVPQIEVPKAEITVKQQKPQIVIQKVETERVVEKLKDTIRIEDTKQILEVLEGLLSTFNEKLGKEGEAIPVRMTNTFVSGSIGGGGDVDTSDLAKEVTLQSVLDKLIDSPSTEAKQDLILAELEKKADLTETQPVSVSGVATEDTLAKLVGFDKNSNVTTGIVKSGTTTTITETDSVKTLTTVIDESDPDDISITETWS